jgi:hypothetical protein
MTYSPSIESRARRLANKLPREELRKYAEKLQREGKAAAVVFWRAIEVFDEDRSLMASIAATNHLGDAVYARRPNGRLPSDPVGVEQ